MILEVVAGVCLGYGLFCGEELMKPKTKQEVKMTDTAKQEAKAVVKAPEQTIIIAGIIVSGVQLLHDKFVGLLNKIVPDLADDEHSVLSMRFVESLPAEGEKAPFGKFYPDSRSIVINLQRHYTGMVDRALNGDLALSVYAYIWLNLLYSVYHEFRHAHQIADDGEIVDWAKAHQVAEEFAEMMTIQLAKKEDVEPAPWAEDPFFGPYIADFMNDLKELGEGADNIEPHIKQVLEMEEQGFVYLDREEGRPDVILPTLKAYLKLSANDDDPAWDKQPTVANPAPSPEQVVSEGLPTGMTSTGVIAPIAEPGGNVQQGIDGNLEDAPPYEDGDGDDFINPYGIEDNDPAPIPVPTATAATPWPAAQPAPAATPPVTNAPQPVAFGVAGQAQPAAAAPVMPQLVNHGLTPQEIEDCVYHIVMALYTHIYTKCGFMPGQDLGFTQPGAIMTPVSVAHIPNVEKVLIAIDTADAQGNSIKHSDVWNPPANDNRPAGTVRGVVFKDGHLPAYRLYFNINGMEVQRSLLPQNPNKTYPDGHPKAGQLKTWAVLARQGNAIAMLSDGNKPKIKILTPAGGLIGHPSIGGQTTYEYMNF